MVRTQLVVVLTIATIALSAPASANLIANGGFEAPSVTPGTFRRVSNGSSDITPWAVTKTEVDVVHEGFMGPAFEGSQYLDLDGTPGPGGIYQDFFTVPGFTYILTFVYANHTQTNLQPYEATVDVLDGTLSLLGAPVLLTHTTSTNANLDWTPFSRSFVAGGEVTRLTFDSTAPVGSGEAFGGILLDDIAVAIPEASSILCGGLVASVVGVGAAMRRRRARTTA